MSQVNAALHAIQSMLKANGGILVITLEELWEELGFTVHHTDLFHKMWDAGLEFDVEQIASETYLTIPSENF